MKFMRFPTGAAVDGYIAMEKRGHGLSRYHWHGRPLSLIIGNSSDSKCVSSILRSKKKEKEKKKKRRPIIIKLKIVAENG